MIAVLLSTTCSAILMHFNLECAGHTIISLESTPSAPKHMQSLRSR